MFRRRLIRATAPRIGACFGKAPVHVAKRHISMAEMVTIVASSARAARGTRIGKMPDHVAKRRMSMADMATIGAFSVGAARGTWIGFTDSMRPNAIQSVPEAIFSAIYMGSNGIFTGTAYVVMFWTSPVWIPMYFLGKRL